MIFRVVIKSALIILPFSHNLRVRQTDRQTDGRTEFLSLDRVCIPCSAVKITLQLSVSLQKFNHGKIRLDI